MTSSRVRLAETILELCIGVSPGGSVALANNVFLFFSFVMWKPRVLVYHSVRPIGCDAICAEEEEKINRHEKNRLVIVYCMFEEGSSSIVSVEYVLSMTMLMSRCGGSL